MIETQSRIQVNDEGDIVMVRQSGRDLAKRLGFGTVDQVRITTAISELARNIFLYTDGGEICLQSKQKPGKVGLNVYAKDRGPGIANIRKVLGDGYTTSGGLGAGLPGVKRLMDEFTIQSEVGEGTEIEATKWMMKEKLGAVDGMAQSQEIPG